MKAVIIEDEIPAQMNLRRELERNCTDVSVIEVFGSVRASVAWLRANPSTADVIFMDVQLSDGMCFDIFEQVAISSPVIITTAYDNYAVRAFRVRSIDYLLKPIDPTELHDAVERCRTAHTAASVRPVVDLQALREALLPDSNPYRERFVIRLGDKIIVVRSEDAAYFYAEDKSTYVITRDGRRYIMDMSLDAVSEMVDPRRFFRISRNCTVSLSAICDIRKHLSNRLKVTLSPAADFDCFVSRSRTADFLDWIAGK